MKDTENAVYFNDPDELRQKTGLLKEGLSWISFFTFLFCCMVSIASLVFINAAQTFVLLDLLNYPHDKLGNASGNLAFSDELLCIPMVSFWGFLSDRIGRKTVMSSGLILMAIAIFLYPWAHVVFPAGFAEFFSSLIFYRLIFASGGSACTAMMTAIIGDYARGNTRARIAGCTGTAAGLGALLSVLILVRLPLFFSKTFLDQVGFKRPDIVFTYGITSAILLIAAISSTLLMAGSESQIRDELCLKDRITTGFLAIKRPLIALAYLSGFVARADSIALNLFIGPWVENYLRRTGECPPQESSLGPVVRCAAAKRLTSNMMGVSHLATLIGAPLFGILSDRLGPVKAVAVPSLIGMISFGILGTASEPKGVLVYIGMFLSGSADIGMIISSMALISSQSTPTQRGALAGVYSLFGAIGIIVTSKLGGFLFDNYGETKAFYIVSISSGIVFILIVLAILMRVKMYPI